MPNDCSECVVKNKMPVQLIGIVVILIFATLCILVWFTTDLGTQVAAFILSFVGVVIAIVAVALPVRCQPCECAAAASASAM